MSNRYSDSVRGDLSADNSESSGYSYTDRFRVIDDRYGSDVVPSRVDSSRAASSSAMLTSLIERACSGNLLEPNLSLNLEISDLINQKKGNAPRDAATTIVKLINSKNPHISILALAVLDICVKNCGYPFHLQISRKEFLNELVRKFPERPPMNYTRVQALILEAIQEWWETICCTSKYKDDLGYIRDMHRLLSYKGYVFPQVNVADAAVLNPSDNLRSAAELEQEEREAQAAKLQELIRRGTPGDLQEANHLMKIMAGYQENRTDYRAKAAKDVDKTRRKAEILEEMLHNVKQGDVISSDDVFSEIVSTLKNARPKIQKMIEEESGDEEAVSKLLALNDYIHSLVEKYDLLKDGKFDQAKNVVIVPLKGGRVPATATTKPSLIDSLIDLNDEEEQKQQGSSQETSNTEDLLGALDGLSFSNSTFGLGGNISLGVSSPSSPVTDLLGNTTVFNPVTTSRSPIASPIPRNSSATSTPPPAYRADYSALHALSPPIQSNSRPSSIIADSDWNFSTAAPLPTPSAYQTTANVQSISVSKSKLAIDFSLFRESDTTVVIKALFSNTVESTISNLNFQLAVPKSLSLRMEPQSGVLIPPITKNGLTQVIRVDGVKSDSNLRLRWKVSYSVAGSTVQEQGTTDYLPKV